MLFAVDSAKALQLDFEFFHGNYLMNVLNQFQGCYGAILLFFAPITSVLFFPDIQGTTPGYLLTFLTLPIAFFSSKERCGIYFRIVLFWVFVWMVFLCVSQIHNYIVPIQINAFDLKLINPNEASEVLRKSLFTQSVYLWLVVMYSAFVYAFYNISWDRGLRFGAGFMAIYGCYEFIYFIVFNESGDFLSNRMFGVDMESSGSAVQTMIVAGEWFMRVKSLTGEPSMYAFTMMPFLFYGSAMNWGLLLRVLITLSVVLTASTSALLAVLVALVVSLFHGNLTLRFFAFSIGGGALVLAVFNEFAVDLVDQVITSKALGENFSGSDRWATFAASIDFWSGLTIVSKLFGVGFGTIRSTDFCSTLLVNCGVLGLSVFLLLFLYPIVRLGSDDRSLALKKCIASTFIVMLVSVPEYAYLAPWTFLAMAYREVSGLDKRHSSIYRLDSEPYVK